MRGSPKAPARRRRRRAAAIVAVAALALSGGGYVSASLLTPISATGAVVTAPRTSTVAAPTLPLPSYGAAAVKAVGFDSSLATSGDTAPRPIASISKVVTALVVLSKQPLHGGDGPTITFTAADHDLYDSYLAQDGEVAPMPTGSTLTERQTLQVALIKSANNYAGALAAWAFGSSDAFVAATTSWLNEHGLHHTTLVEPTGLDPHNVSTTTDLIALGQLALADPDIASIVSTPQTTIPGVGTIVNSNALLGVDGIDGVKTGTLPEAGACLLFAATQEIDKRPVTVIGVILGGSDHVSIDRDVTRLLTSVRSGFHTVRIVDKGEVYGTYSTAWGIKARAVADRSVDELVYGAPVVQARPTLEPASDAGAGRRVGSVAVSVEGRSTSVPLVLDSPLPGPTLWWRLTHPALHF